jgi:AcrR family transcriptional regulator
MARKPTPDAHERILDAAAGLFDRYGVHAVGMQQIIDEFGCGKNLLYREFRSKDELVVAYLAQCGQDWTAIVDQAAEAAPDDPVGQLVAIVRIVAEQTSAPGFRGCAVRNAHADFPDPDHPAHRLAVDHYLARREHLRELARRARAADPDGLADRILLIIDGLNTAGAVFGPDGATQVAVTFAEEVLAAAAPPR